MELETKIALLEQAQEHHEQMIQRLLTLAETTRELISVQTSRLDREQERAIVIARDMDDHKANDKQFHNEVNTQIKELIESQNQFLKDFKEELTKITTSLEKRVSFLERWWYMVMGGFVVIGVILKALWNKFF